MALQRVLDRGNSRWEKSLRWKKDKFVQGTERKPVVGMVRLKR